MKIKLLFGTLAVCSIPLLSGCNDTNNNNITLRIAQASASDGAIGVSLDKFSKDVFEKSNGRIKILTFHNGQLGSERENIESVQMGDLDMAVVNQSVLINFLPELAAFDLPYTITSAKHADKVFLGEIGNHYLKELENVRLKGFSIWEFGFRNLTNSVRDVNKVADVNNLRIRVMENKIHQELWMALGADPVPMSWSDAYTGMQQGAIDGQENPATVIDKNNVVEVNKHMAVTEHCYSTVYILFSTKIWDQLSSNDQEILTKCMRKAELDERALSRKMDKEAIFTLESKGMNVTYPNKQGFIQKSAIVREKYGATFKDLLDKIQALAD